MRFCTMKTAKPGQFMGILFVSIFFILLYTFCGNFYDDIRTLPIPVFSIGRLLPVQNELSMNVQKPQTTNTSLGQNVGQIDAGQIQILLWTTSVAPRQKFYVGDESLPGCPVKCDFTDDKKLIDEAHAVVVLGIDDRENELESNLPPQRKWNQIRIFYLWESPHWFQQEFVHFPNSKTVNWTMTYRRDSTIPELYGYFQPWPPNSSPKITQSEIEQLVQTKTKLIAWTVTRCHSVSRREDLVDKMMKYVPIDKFGTCGTLQCDAPRYAHDWKSCYRQLGQSYKFYLSFENSLCADYVTEKLFYALENGLVPIVYGGANYEYFAPPGSYIDVRAFESVQKLAEYIHFLDKNDAEYLKYFEWKKQYQIQYKNKWCSLCQKLWDVSVVDDDKSGGRIIDPNYHSGHEDLSKWYHYVNKTLSNGKSYLSPACWYPPNFKLM